MRQARPTAFATRVSVVADVETLYLGVTCTDPEPARIAVHTLERDADLTADDTIAFVLDTFGDGRTGYLFRITAGGARQDGLLSGAADPSYDWDGAGRGAPPALDRRRADPEAALDRDPVSGPLPFLHPE